MSELKCPCCGNDLKETYLGYVCSNTRLKDPCSFRISKEQLPRISAAMELARAVSSLHEGRTPQDYDNVSEAKRRVIEIFGGE